MADIPSAMPENPSDHAWQFLARVARERREFIGLSQEELAQYGGPGKSTVGKIENARQTSYPPRTQQQLEKALGWERGAFREILLSADASYFEDQGESIAADYIEEALPDLTVNDTDEIPVRSAAELSDDELLAELTYRMKRYATEVETPVNLNERRAERDRQRHELSEVDLTVEPSVAHTPKTDHGENEDDPETP